MKTFELTSTINKAQSNRRRGSTLVVVLTLLALLAVLGFTFFTFSAQERSAAEYFATESQTSNSSIPDTIFDWPLRQILIGPDDSTYNSVLWGGRFSLVPGMVGRDRIPFNGAGVNLMSVMGQPRVDMNFDGAADPTDDLLGMVDSPVANANPITGVLINSGTGKDLTSLPEPDIEYSYPDINNCLLSYDGFVLDAAKNPQRVFIPTLMRPQYLRKNGAPILDWYNNTVDVTASKSFRPHPDHFYVDASGSTGIRRFVGTQAEANNLRLTRPFSFAPLDANGVPTSGALGLWTGAPATTMNLDVDTDGDGVRESILVDLGYAPFERSDGKLVVPLFAIQIRDLNGLLNLNAATSTLSKVPFPPDITTQEFGADSAGNPKYLSNSNQGALSGEVNSVYGLTTDQTAVTSSDLIQYRFFLKMIGSDRNPLSAREIANLEWFFLVNGRPRFNVESATNAGIGVAAMAPTIETVTPGLLGDVDSFIAFFSAGGGKLPQPGMVSIDDNIDATNTTFPFLWTNQASAFPPLGMPLDLAGNGSILLPNNSSQNPFGKKLNFLDYSTQPAIGANRWLIHQGFHSNNDVYLKNAASSAYAAQLVPLPSNQLLDDPTELVTDPSAFSIAKNLPTATSVRKAVDNDSILSLSETAFLQLGESDNSALVGASRVAALAPLNTVTSPAAQDIRKQYSTVSSGRREFGKFTTALTAATTPAVSAQMRQWENTYLDAVSTSLRPVVWALLAGVAGPVPSTRFRNELRLSSNQLLVDGSGDPFPATVPTTLTFRDLTPHPSRDPVPPLTGPLSSSPIPVPTAPLAYSGPNFPTIAEQEYFARRDRQALASDIYVLLYMYGAGLDQNPMLTSPATYTSAQKKEMAQFAVNYVDALDRDTVITRFEYDTDLSNGWGLDDNPYTTNDSDRSEVWGVEAQQLTFSEALAIKAPKVVKGAVPYNHPATEYDDTDDRFFTYIDLQNASPYAINLAQTPAWQIRVLPRGLSTTTVHERRLTPFFGQIAAGGSFTILNSGSTATRDAMGNPTSYFRVDPYYISPGTPKPFLIAPATIPPVGSRLDLIVDPPANYLLTDGALNQMTALGQLLNTDNASDPASSAPPSSIVFRLMRRADVNRAPPTTPPEELDNPWIEVDRMTLGVDNVTNGLKLFPLLDSTDANSASPTSLTDLLTALRSRVRSEPFAADQEQEFLTTQYWYNVPAPPTWAPRLTLKYLANYIGQGKFDPISAVGPTATHAQYHYDRPFASLGEIMNVPLVGPGLYAPSEANYDAGEAWYLTRALGHANKSPRNQVSVGAPDKRAFTAAAKFLQADFPDALDNAVSSDNRWYRLFEFLEVPSPAHRYQELHDYSVNALGLPKNFGWPRTQGQLNLNMVRHPAVLAGLLDDNLVLNVQPTSLPSRDTSDTAAYGIRDWWIEFQRSRDGFDPTTNLFIPGTASSRPFRGFNFTARGQFSQKEDSLLRSLPADSAVIDQRNLFEIGQSSEHVAGTLDSLAQNRLLTKILNNATTKTHSYGVFIAVQYFEAAQTSGSPSAIRIGGRLEDTPMQRAFFILDTSGAIEQMKSLASNLRNATIIISPTDPMTDGTNFPISSRTFSIVPNTDSSGDATRQNGIRWQDLVLYKQILE